jgi:hypothetical protein
MTEIQTYLQELRRHLSVDAATEEEILKEVRSHLEESAVALQAEGLCVQESQRLAIERFGNAREVAGLMRRVHSSSVNEAILASCLPVALTLSFKWVALPLLASIGHWQGNPTPIVFGALAMLALLVPGLTMHRWRYGYAAWAFFSVIAIAEIGT